MSNMENTNNGMELFQDNSIEQYVAFDYSELDSKIALELQQKAKKARMIMKNIESKTMELRETLFDAHKLLANHHKGSFQSWVKSEIGISPRHATNLLQIERFSNSWELVPNSKDKFENLGYKAQLLVANPNTLPEVKELALSGEVTKYAELKALNEQLALEKTALENKVTQLAGLSKMVDDSEKEKKALQTEKEAIEEQLKLKEFELMLAQSNSNEVKKVIEKVVVEKEVIPESMQLELKQANEQLTALRQAKQTASQKATQLQEELEKLKLENKDLQVLKDKEAEITKIYAQLENLKREKSNVVKQMEDEIKIFTSLKTVKDTIKNELLYIPTLVVNYNNNDVMKREIKNLVDLLDNLKVAFINKFEL